MLKLERVSDAIVHPIPKKDVGNVKIVGGDIMSNPFGNVICIASTNSGKTTALFELIKKITDPKLTKVILITSTLFNDDSYDHIQKYLESKDYDFEAHSSIVDDDTKQNRLIELLDELKLEAQVAKELEEQEEERKRQKALQRQKKKGLESYKRTSYVTADGVDQIVIDQEEDKKQRKEKKSKKLAQKILIILDDVSDELRNKSLAILAKKSRHFKIRLIVSTQYLLDLMPAARKQFYYGMLFGGMGVAKLETVYKDLDISWIFFERFVEIYNLVTSKPYQFLFVDRSKRELRQNFTDKIIL